MPIRTASLNGRIKKNGAKLHLATLSRIHSLGADHEPSAAEQALADERRLLKEEKGEAPGGSAAAEGEGRQVGENAPRAGQGQAQGKTGTKGAQSEQGPQAVACREARREGGGPGGREEGDEEVGEDLRERRLDRPGLAGAFPGTVRARNALGRRSRPRCLGVAADAT